MWEIVERSQRFISKTTFFFTNYIILSLFAKRQILIQRLQHLYLENQSSAYAEEELKVND